MCLKTIIFIRIRRLEWRNHELALIASVCSAVMSTFDDIFEFVLYNQRMTKWRMIRLIYLDTKEKPFKCTCDASFARRDLLKRHQNLTHGTTKGHVPEKPSPSIPESSQQSSQPPMALDDHLTTQRSPSLPDIEPENLESYAGMTWSRTMLEVFPLHTVRYNKCPHPVYATRRGRGAESYCITLYLAAGVDHKKGGLC